MSEQEELIRSIIDALGPRPEDDRPLVVYGSPRVRRLVGVYQAFLDERLEALRERLKLAEDVCLMYGWSAGPGDSPRSKAATELWMRWARSPLVPDDFTDPKQHPDLDDDAVERLAAERDATRARTLARLFHYEDDPWE